MGLRCFVCKKILKNVKELVRHLKFLHAFYPGKSFLLSCDQDGCHQKFQTYNSFKKHLYKKHCNGNVENGDGDDDDNDNDEEPIPPFNQPNGSSDFLTEHPQATTCNADNRKNTQDMCATLIAKLKSSGVPTTVISSVVENFEKELMN